MFTFCSKRVAPRYGARGEIRKGEIRWLSSVSEFALMNTKATALLSHMKPMDATAWFTQHGRSGQESSRKATVASPQNPIPMTSLKRKRRQSDGRIWSSFISRNSQSAELGPYVSKNKRMALKELYGVINNKYRYLSDLLCSHC